MKMGSVVTDSQKMAGNGTCLHNDENPIAAHRCAGSITGTPSIDENHVGHTWNLTKTRRQTTPPKDLNKNAFTSPRMNPFASQQGRVGWWVQGSPPYFYKTPHPYMEGRYDFNHFKNVHLFHHVKSHAFTIAATLSLMSPVSWNFFSLVLRIRHGFII